MTSIPTCTPSHTPTHPPTATATAIPCVASIYREVWNDLNRNGLNDVGEPPLAGAEIRLKDFNHTLVDSWVTQAGGTYAFVNLTSRLQYVGETDPPGCGSTTTGEISLYLNAGQSLPVHFGDYALPTATPTPTPTAAVELNYRLRPPVVTRTH